MVLRFLGVLLAAFLSVGCGGGQGSAEAGDPAVPASAPALTVHAGPSPPGTDRLRFTAHDAWGRVVLGPLTRSVQSEISLAVSPEAVELQVEYLAGTEAVGLAREPLNRADPAPVTARPVDLRTGIAALQMVVEPGRVPAGARMAARARALCRDGRTLDVGAVADWTSSDENVLRAAPPDTFQALAVGSARLGVGLGALADSRTVEITGAPLQALEVWPTRLLLARGAEAHLQAFGVYADGTRADLTRTVSWSGAQQGVTRAGDPGEWQVGAALGERSASAEVRVTAARPIGLEIAPADLRLPRGTERQMAATLHLADGGSVDVTSRVRWTSSDPSVAGISGAGRLQARGPGSAEVQAQWGAHSAGSEVRVTEATLEALHLDPPRPRLLPGVRERLTATGRFSDGTVLDLTDEAVWSSSPPDLLDLGPGGAATGRATGAATVTGRVGDLAASAPVAIAAATLVSVQVAPPEPRLAVGTSLLLNLTATYSDGSTRDVAEESSWFVDAPAVAALGNEAGVRGFLHGVAPGEATVSVFHQGKQATAEVQVTSATLQGLAVGPPPAAVPVGMTAQLAAQGTFSDGTSQDMTGSVRWTTSDRTVATVSSAPRTWGRVTGRGAGSAAVEARHGAITASASMTVSAAELRQLTLSPAGLRLPLEASQPLQAWGVFSDGSVLDVAGQVTWSSSAPDVAAVSPAGMVTALATGEVDLVALHPESGTKARSHLLVTGPALEAVEIAGPASPVPVGRSEQLSALGRYADGSTRDLTLDVSWTSSAPEVATVGNARGSRGLATALAPGTATVTVLHPGTGLGDSEVVQVVQASLQRLDAAPADARVPAGIQIPLTVHGRFSDGGYRDLTASLTWTSTDPQVAAVSSGVVTGVAPGSATVAALDPSSGLAVGIPVTVTDASLTSLLVTPAGAIVRKGEGRALEARGVFSDGSFLRLTEQVSWTSADPLVMAVENGPGSRGRILGVAPGRTSLQAALPGVGAHASVEVQVVDFRLLGSIPVGRLHDMRCTADGTRLAVLDETARQLRVFDVASRDEVGQVPTAFPSGIELAGNGDLLVTHYEPTILVIDPSTLQVDTVTTAASYLDLTLGPPGRAYALRGDGRVDVLDPQGWQLIATFVVPDFLGTTLRFLDWSAATGRLYAGSTMYSPSRLCSYAISDTSMTSVQEVEASIPRAAFCTSPDGRAVVAWDGATSLYSAADLRAVEGGWSFRASAAVFSPDGQRIYATDSGGVFVGTTADFTTLTRLVPPLRTGQDPIMLEVSPDHRHLFIHVYDDYTDPFGAVHVYAVE